MAIQQTFQRKSKYKDFDLNFTKHPLTNDLAVKKGVAAVNQSVKNLIQTAFYERPFQPTLGSQARSLLFETADAITISNMRRVIKEVIQNHEPRVRIKNIVIRDMTDSNAYGIELRYEMNDIKTDENLSIVLERLR